MGKVSFGHLATLPQREWGGAAVLPGFGPECSQQVTAGQQVLSSRYPPRGHPTNDTGATQRGETSAHSWAAPGCLEGAAGHQSTSAV